MNAATSSNFEDLTPTGQIFLVLMGVYRPNGAASERQIWHQLTKLFKQGPKTFFAKTWSEEHLPLKYLASTVLAAQARLLSSSDEDGEDESNEPSPALALGTLLSPQVEVDLEDRRLALTVDIHDRSITAGLRAPLMSSGSDPDEGFFATQEIWGADSRATTFNARAWTFTTSGDREISTLEIVWAPKPPAEISLLKGGVQISVEKLSMKFTLQMPESSAESPTFGVALTIDGLTIELGSGEGPLAMLRRAKGLKAKSASQITLSWSSDAPDAGFAIEGNSELSVELKGNKDAHGLIRLERLLAEIELEASTQTGSDLDWSIAADATLHAGIAEVSLHGIGARGGIDLTNPFRCSGDEPAARAVCPQLRGASLRLLCDSLALSAHLEWNDPTLSGAAFLDVGPMCLDAGVLLEQPNEVDYLTLLARIGASFKGGLPLAPYVSLTGVGGALVVNRDVERDKLYALLKGNKLSFLMDQTPADAQAIVAALKEAKALFPPMEGRRLVAPFLRMTVASVLDLSAGLLIDLNQPDRSALLLSMELCKDIQDVTPVRLKMHGVGVYDRADQRCVLRATLVDSRIGKLLKLNGEALVWLGWGAGRAGFLIAVGGVHPSFVPPKGCPPVQDLQRLQSSFSFNKKDSDNVDATITLNCYLAIGHTAIMVGANTKLEMKKADWTFKCKGQFDTLVQWQPMHIESKIRWKLEAKRKNESVVQGFIKGSIKGPGPWVIRGRVELEVMGALNVERDIYLEVGEKETSSTAHKVNVGELLVEALSAPSALTVEHDPKSGLKLRPSKGDDTRRLAPTDHILLSQSVAPLGEMVTRHSGFPVTRSSTWKLTCQALTASQSSQKYSTTVTTLNASFLPGQYSEPTMQQQLQGGGMRELACGLRLSSDTEALGAVAKLSPMMFFSEATKGWRLNEGLTLSAQLSDAEISYPSIKHTLFSTRVDDVIGLSNDEVELLWPPHGARDADPDERVCVRLRSPDLPWRLSSVNGAPWLAVVVAEQTVGLNITKGPDGQTLLNEIDHNSLLSRRDYAHVISLSGSTEWDTLRAQVLGQQKLNPNTAYVAALVGVPADNKGRAIVLRRWSFSTGATRTTVSPPRLLAPPPGLGEATLRWSTTPNPRTLSWQGPVGPAATVVQDDDAKDMLQAMLRAPSGSEPTLCLSYGDPNIDTDPTRRIAAGVGAALVREHSLTERRLQLDLARAQRALLTQNTRGLLHDHVEKQNVALNNIMSRSLSAKRHLSKAIISSAATAPTMRSAQAQQATPATATATATAATAKLPQIEGQTHTVPLIHHMARYMPERLIPGVSTLRGDGLYVLYARAEVAQDILTGANQTIARELAAQGLAAAEAPAFAEFWPKDIVPESLVLITGSPAVAWSEFTLKDTGSKGVSKHPLFTIRVAGCLLLGFESKISASSVLVVSETGRGLRFSFTENGSKVQSKSNPSNSASFAAARARSFQPIELRLRLETPR